MFPKHLIPASPGPDYEMPVHMSSEADENDEAAGGIDESPCTCTFRSVLGATRASFIVVL